ncbi:MAG: hypothetical protein HONBIEJF_00974 [Fimbriimonadaceae bacterium]|nr:hypothetical protein [Fimbriimonadaceae bacterium]
MAWAIRAIYTDNSAPDYRLFSSGGVMISTCEQDVFGNFAIGLQPGDLEEATRHLSGLEAPSMLIESGERKDAYESAIAPSGYAHVGTIPAMTVSLDVLPAVELPEGYLFERVSAGSGGESWAETLSLGYPVATKAAQSMSPVHASVDDAADAKVQFFQVRQGEVVAGVSAMALLNDLAGIYCVATLQEHRRKGIGAALTALPLLAARELGFETGVLQSSEAGYPVYRKLGFEDSGQVQLYLRVPPGSDVVH